jgi:hypothetical protein
VASEIERLTNVGATPVERRCLQPPEIYNYIKTSGDVRIGGSRVEKPNAAARDERRLLDTKKGGVSRE